MQRLAVVDARSRTGYWECDTIIGAQHQEAMVSLIKRRQYYALLAKVEYNTTVAVRESVVSLLDPYRARSLVERHKVCSLALYVVSVTCRILQSGGTVVGRQ